MTVSCNGLPCYTWSEMRNGVYKGIQKGFSNTCSTRFPGDHLGFESCCQSFCFINSCLDTDGCLRFDPEDFQKVTIYCSAVAQLNISAKTICCTDRCH